MKQIKKYAELIVKICAQMYRKTARPPADRCGPGSACYYGQRKNVTKAGASYVEVIWECGPINKLNYQYATARNPRYGSDLGGRASKDATVDLLVRIFV